MLTWLIKRVEDGQTQFLPKSMVSNHTNELEIDSAGDIYNTEISKWYEEFLFSFHKNQFPGIPTKICKIYVL